MSTPELPLAARRSLLLRFGVGVALSLVVVGALLVVVLVLVRDPDNALAGADPGRTTETLYEWEGPVPRFTNVTELWGLDEWRNTSDRSASGGVAVADLDQDGLLDVALAGGDPRIYFGNGTGFTPAAFAPIIEAVAVTAGDLDGDGRVDLVFGGDGEQDVIVWNAGWLRAGDPAQAEMISNVPGGAPTTGVLIGDLTGDGVADLLRLGYGGSRPSADVVYEQVAPRQFVGVPLPNSERRSLAAEVANLGDADALDIWVTRDIGWQDGGDSIYRRQGSSWIDVASDLGGSLEIDGMGVTLADLTGDGELDAYLSDIGENEFLERATGSGFTPYPNSGANRIRPPGADPSIVSSTWASGVADLNLDGIVDLVAVNGGFPDEGVVNKVADSAILDADPPALFFGLGEGRYADVWDLLGLEWRGSGRGLALGDLDGDGDVDLIITTVDEGMMVLRNDTTAAGLVIAFEPACDWAGVEVAIETTVSAFHVLAAPSAFLGRHSTGVIVGGEVQGVMLVAGGRQIPLSAPFVSPLIVDCALVR